MVEVEKVDFVSFFTQDIQRAKQFYGDTLGLELDVRRDDLPQNREAEFRAGDGTLVVYESVGAGQSRHTLASFVVDDLDGAMGELRGSGVSFEEYDMPGLTTVDGIAEFEGGRGAWFKDPDGNILAVTEGM